MARRVRKTPGRETPVQKVLWCHVCQCTGDHHKRPDGTMDFFSCLESWEYLPTDKLPTHKDVANPQ